MDGTASWLLGALLLQGALTVGIAVWLGVIRVGLVARGQVKVRDIALSRQGWPDRANQIGNALDNQFQLPVLFYVAVVVALYLGPVLPEVLLAWLFVASRCVHAGIHLTDNHVIRRFFAYLAGLAAVALLWLDLLVRLLLGAGGAG